MICFKSSTIPSAGMLKHADVMPCPSPFGGRFSTQKLRVFSGGGRCLGWRASSLSPSVGNEVWAASRFMARAHNLNRQANWKRAAPKKHLLKNECGNLTHEVWYLARNFVHVRDNMLSRIWWNFFLLLRPDFGRVLMTSNISPARRDLWCSWHNSQWGNL